MKRNILTVIIAILFVPIILWVFKYFTLNSQIMKQDDQLAQAIRLDKKQIKPKTTIYFVGDMMLDRGVKSSVYKNFNGDYSKLFENLGELKNADILFANLEGDVSDKGRNVGSKYSFRMEPKVLPVIKEAGFDIVSFANNHVGDWSSVAFKDTLIRLNENQILKTGAGMNKKDVEDPTIIEKNGIKFGFIGFSDVGPNWLEAKESNAGILLANDPNIESIIKNAKEKSDVLIVSFHFGEEYKTIHNARQEKLAHIVIDNGADIVIGHHPHVMQDIEEYKGKLIVYSLGNFIFDQYFSKETMRGMLLIANFEGNALINFDRKIITLNKKYQPEGIFEYEDIIKKDKIKESSNCPKPDKKYEDRTLFNINKDNKLPEADYIPEDLSELGINYSIKEKICLTKETKEHLISMLDDAQKEGYTIKVSSGFRSYDTQDLLYKNATIKDSRNAIISIAKPGYSEHQLGTVVDLTNKSISFITASEKFGATKEAKWLTDNAYLYGFILSYPNSKTGITGYKYEPWHYRYVGIENAKEIKETNLTITEFLK